MASNNMLSTHTETSFQTENAPPQLTAITIPKCLYLNADPLHSQPHPAPRLQHCRSNVQTHTPLRLQTVLKPCRACIPSALRRPVIFRVVEGTGSFLCIEGRSTVELPWRTRKVTCSPESSGPGRSERALHRSAAERTGSARPCSPGSRPAALSPALGWAPSEG